MSPGLRILLLGPPLVLSGDQSLALSRRGLRSLLYYLACQPEPQTRGQLGLLFWEDLPEAKMRKNLREMLSRLRTELPDAEMLRVDQEYVWLDESNVTTDVREFLLLYEQAARLLARIPSPSPLPEGLRDTIHRALNLWRGTRFLPGDDLTGSNELEAWAGHMGIRLNVARRSLLEHIATHENLVGNLDSAAAFLRAALEIDPVDDALVMRLVNVLERGGRISEAVAACQNAREAYARHGVEFSPALERVCERVRAHAGRQQAGPSGLEPRRSLQLPLIGRETALEALRLAFQRHSPVAVLGEAGAGKSRLLQEFCAMIQPGVRVFTAAAHQMGGGVPFQPLIDMLRGGVNAEEWHKLPNSWTTILTLLLPELATLVPEISMPPTNSALNQPLVFEALHQVLRAVASQQRLVLLLDNAQWCDETTFNALHFLFEKHLFATDVFLIVAAREEEHLPALARFLKRFEGQGSTTSLKLRPLTQGNIHQIIQMVFAANFSNDLAERLQRDTGGNPFYLLETLRLMLEYSTDSLATVIPLAGSVHLLMRERLQRLSPEAQAALSLAAVAGSEFSLELLETAGRYNSEQMVGLVEEIERAQLIQPAAEKDLELGGKDAFTLESRILIRYQFAQERVREILLMEISPARRRLFHLRVAEVLKGQEVAVPGAQAAVLAEHYQQAGEVKEAFDYWLKAAAHARRLYSLTEQQYAYEQAEKILFQAENAIDGSEILKLYSGWIELGFTQASAEITRRSAEAVLRQGWRRENQQLIRAGFLGLSAAANLDEQGEAVLQHLEQARPFIENGGHLNDRLSFHFNRGSALILLGRMEEAVQELERAMELAANAGDNPAAVEVRANCGYLLSGALLFSGWPEQAVKIAEKSLADSRAVMSHASAARAIAMLGMANYYLGHYAEADEQNNMALRMAMPMQNMRLISQLYADMAQQSLALGRIDEGWRQAGQALEAGQQCNFMRAMAQAYRVQGDAHRLLVANEEAIALYRQAVAAGGNSPAGMDALYRLGLALVQSDHTEEGMAAIERCIGICRGMGMGLQLIFALGTRALALTHLGRFEEAFALAEEVAVQAVKHNLPFLRAMAFMPWGHQALLEGRLDDARQKGLALAEYGQKILNPLMEMSGYLMVLQAGSPPATVRQRVRALMAQIDQNTQEPVLRPHVDRTLARYAELLKD
jgi:DNA-binding SARP family transcriptional activator